MPRDKQEGAPPAPDTEQKELFGRISETEEASSALHIAEDEQAPEAETPMASSHNNNNAEPAPPRWKKPVFITAIVACVLVLCFSLWQIMGILVWYRQTDEEYAQVLEDYGPGSGAFSRTPFSALEEGAEEEVPANPREAAQANPDYVAWIEIKGTKVNYPVVKGADNEYYLNRTFLGNTNAAGAIFMDCRNAADFSSYHTLLYGHNVRSGSMFGTLDKYLDSAYMAANPAVTITVGEENLNYTVFHAAVYDMYDPVFSALNFASPEELTAFAAGYGLPQGLSISRLLTLSTCTNNAENERVLVFAYL